MSINIPCPNCGLRPVEEFVYGEITDVPDEIMGAEARDLDRAFMFDNPEGVQEEAWFHSYGCRRWLKIWRDTRTDEIVG